MKSVKEIEQLASEHILSENGQLGFVLGYIQCQEDMADEKEYWKKENEKIDAKYTKEFDYWQEKAKEMTNKYNDLINKQK
jgi:Txe/YoeB family toxin of Txe-Axe toxin-antitoxin module